MMRTSRETIYKRFLIFICRIVGEMLGLEFCGPIGLLILTANLLKYVHVLKIEGEIAVLSLYCNNCYTAKKSVVRIVRFLCHVERIINSAYISFFLYGFLISYQGFWDDSTKLKSSKLFFLKIMSDIL